MNNKFTDKCTNELMLGEVSTAGAKKAVNSGSIIRASENAPITKVYKKGMDSQELYSELETESSNAPTLIGVPAVKEIDEPIFNPALVEELSRKIRSKVNETTTVISHSIKALISQLNLQIDREKLQELYNEAVALTQKQPLPKSIQVVMQSPEPKRLELGNMVNEKYIAMKYLQDPQAALSKIRSSIKNEDDQLKYFILNTLLSHRTIVKVDAICKDNPDALELDQKQRQYADNLIKKENEEKEKQAKHAEPLSTLQSTLKEFSDNNPKWERTLSLLKVAESVTTNDINEAIAKAHTITLPKNVQILRAQANRVLNAPDTQLEEEFKFNSKLDSPAIRVVSKLIYWKRVYDEAEKQEQRERKEQKLKDNRAALMQKFNLKKQLSEKLNNLNPLARQRLIELADRQVATIAEAFAKAEKQGTYPVNSLNDLFMLENESTEIIESIYSAEIDKGAKMTQIIKIANALNAIDDTRDTLVNTELPPAYPKFVNFVDAKNKGALVQKIFASPHLEMKEIKGLSEVTDRESGEKMDKYYMVSNKNDNLTAEELIARGAPRVVNIMNKEQYKNLKNNKELDITDLITSGYIDEDTEIPKKVVAQKNKLKTIEGKLNETETSSTKKVTIYHPADLFKNEIKFRFGEGDDFEKMLQNTDMKQSMQITEAIMNEVVYNSIEHSKGNYTALMVDIKKDKDGNSTITLNIEDNGSVSPSYKNSSGKIVDWKIAFEELCQLNAVELQATVMEKARENYKQGKQGGVGMISLAMLKKNYDFDIRYERGTDGKNRFTAVGTLKKATETEE